MSISRPARSWIVFAAGVTLFFVAWAYWMMQVGPTWWAAYSPAESGTLSIGKRAEKVGRAIFWVGFTLCVVAPFLSPAPLKRQIFHAMLAGAAAVVLINLLGIVVFFGFYGF